MRTELPESASSWRKSRAITGAAAAAPDLASQRILDQQNLLLAISDASLCYINGRQNVRHVYSRVLDALLALTNSEYGLIGEVRYEGGIPHFGEHALTCVTWEPSFQAKDEATHKGHLSLRNLDPRFGETIQTSRVVIGNEPASDTGAIHRPLGHPTIQSFLGIPVFSGSEVVAVIALANRPGGYSAETADFLKPMASTLANITVAWRLEFSRRSIEMELAQASVMMRALVERTPSAVMFENASRRLEFVNPKFAKMFGIEASPEQVIGIDAALVAKHSKQLFRDSARFMDRVEDLIAGEESFYGERVEMIDGSVFQRDFVVVRSGAFVCGYFWHYRECTNPLED